MSIKQELDAFMHLAEACGLTAAISIKQKYPDLLVSMAKQPYRKQIPWLYVQIWKLG